MKIRCMIMALTIALTALTTSVSGQQPTVPDEILVALKGGDSKLLSKYFSSSVELVILDKEGVYSKTQAEFILKEFFTKNIPNNYVKLHEPVNVKKDASKAVIGKLSTAKGQFRVYFLMINVNGQFSINQLRIENDTN